MTLTIDLTEEEFRRVEEARRHGVNVDAMIHGIIAGLPIPANIKPMLSEKQKAAIALMHQWVAEDATDDPDEIARREADWEEMERNLEANRLTLPIPEV